MVPFESLGQVLYSHFIATMAASLAVSGIFSLKEWRDLEIWDWDRSRSLKMALFHRLYTTFHCRPLGHCMYNSILSCIIFELLTLNNIMTLKSRLEVTQGY